MATDIPSGPGSANPNWSPPSVPVATPGLNQQAQPTQFDQLRQAVITLAGGTTAALNAAGSIKRNLDSLKEQSINKIDRDLRGQAMSFQAQRLASQRRQMLALTIEAEDKGPAWLANEARTRIENAASAEEEQLWTGMFGAASQAAKAEEQSAARDAEMRIKQQYSLAGRTAHNVVSQLSQQLVLDPELRQELIGDGRNIHSRVQDWVMSEVTAASPDAFVFGPRDPMRELKAQQREMLTSALVGESLGIADGLVREVAARREQGNFSHGIEQIDSDLFDFLTKDGDLKQLTNSASAVFDEQLNHMPEDQKTEAWKKRAADALRAAAQGQFGTDIGPMLSRADQVLNMKIGDQPVFTPLERAEVGQALLDTASKTAGRLFDAAIESEVSKMTQVVTDSQGNTYTVPDANASIRLATPDSTGLTPIDRAANLTLMNMGLAEKKPEDLSYGEWLVSGTVRGRASDLSREYRSVMQKRAVDIGNYSAVLQGQPNADIEDAYGFSPYTRVMSGQQVTPEEASALRTSVVEASLDLYGGVPESIQTWSGVTMPERTTENRPLRQAIAAARSLEWSNAATAEEYGIPKGFATEIRNLLTSGDVEKVHDALAYTTTFRSNARLEDLLQAVSKDGDSQIGAALLYGTLAQNGMLAAPGEGKPGLETISQEVQNILEAGPLDRYLSQRTLAPKDNATNRRVIYSNTINALRGMYPNIGLTDPAKLQFDDQLQGMFISAMQEGNTVARDIERLGMAFVTNHPHAKPENVGAFIASYLSSNGLRIYRLNDRPYGVFDPESHLGQNLADLNTEVQQFGSMPLNGYVRDVISQAMGYSPAETPITMAGLFLKERSDAFVNAKPQDLQWSADFGVSPAGRERLSQPAVAGGGAIVTVKHPTTGQLIEPILSRHPVTVNLPGGQQVYLPAGTPISTFSIHHQLAPYEVENRRGHFAEMQTLSIGIGF